MNEKFNAIKNMKYRKKVFGIIKVKHDRVKEKTGCT
jgi:hypothetical protein